MSRSQPAAEVRKPRRAFRARLAYLVARPFFALALFAGKVLPASWTLALGRTLARGVWYVFPGVRRNLRANARGILGEDSPREKRDAIGRGILQSFAVFIIEWVAPKCTPQPDTVFERLVGREHFDGALATGRGAILVSLHMGNYELPGRELAAIHDQVAIVYNRERIGFLESLRSKTRRERGLDEIAIEDSPFFTIEVRRRLREGGVILMAADQVGAPDARPFPFLHGEAPFSLWAARLARASEVPIVPAFCFKNEAGLHRLVLESPIDASTKTPEQTTAELVRVLETWLARYPDQWLMVHDFWGQSIPREHSPD